MKGRAHRLLEDFRRRCVGVHGSFAMSRLILLSRIVPEHVTADLDDSDVEARIQAAIEKIGLTDASDSENPGTARR
jgi:hypothetical protein